MRMSVRAWRPLFRDDDAATARRIVRDIARATTAVPDADGATDAFDLAAGAAGRAVCHAHLGLALGDDTTSVVAALLDAAGDALGRLAFPPGLMSGVAGVAWAHAHCATLGIEVADLCDIDDALLEGLASWDGPYDLIDGLVGLGVYGLERARLDAAGGAIVDAAIDRLAATAEWTGTGCTWCTPPHLAPTETATEGHYNLGLAHGVPGVVGFLGAAASTGHASAATLLEGARTWLVAQAFDASGVSRFANWIAAGDAPTPARLAWCYGDAGVAGALMVAARAAGGDEWREDALAVARHAAARPMGASGVGDAMFCHGAAGLGHVFNRLWQDADAPWLADAARTWLRHAAGARHEGRGVAGFERRAAPHESATGWCDDAGLLTGTAGVALALLAACGDAAPGWDRAFLLSV